MCNQWALFLGVSYISKVLLRRFVFCMKHGHSTVGRSMRNEILEGAVPGSRYKTAVWAATPSAQVP
jgi:hypothetical protein